MLSKVFSSLLVFVFLILAQNQSESVSVIESGSSDDLATLKVILDKCSMSDVLINDVAVIENGRVTSLDLTNKNIALDGISEIPPEIGKLTALRKLVCQNNIVSELPEEIGNLVELQVLIMQSNRINKLTQAIGNCINIVDLDLRHNQLESIPSEIGNLQKLTRLWLWGNKITVLTESITTLKSLKEIYLKDNRLTTLPMSIIKMNLRYFDAIGNKICKPEPELKKWLNVWDKKFSQTQKCW